MELGPSPSRALWWAGGVAHLVAPGQQLTDPEWLMMSYNPQAAGWWLTSGCPSQESRAWPTPVWTEAPQGSFPAWGWPDSQGSPGGACGQDGQEPCHCPSGPLQAGPPHPQVSVPSPGLSLTIFSGS